MSDFKFACPICAQNILTDTNNCGLVISCPSCHQSVTVPAAPHHLAAGESQKTSGLAIASLVCSLFVCIGCIPGIICGHMARGRIRRDPSLKGLGLANTGLIISYLALIGGLAVAALFGIRVAGGAKEAFQKAKSDIDAQIAQQNQLATNAQAATTAPPAATESNDTPATPSAWKLDLNEAKFPRHIAAGKFHGADFKAVRPTYKNGAVTIHHGKGGDNGAFVIHLGLKTDDPLDGKFFRVSPDEETPSAQAEMVWKEDGKTKTQKFARGFALKLEFSQTVSNKVTTKIYLCLPDEQKSYLAGYFKVTVKK